MANTKRKTQGSSQGRSPMLEGSPGGDPRARQQAHAGLVHDLEYSLPLEVNDKGQASLRGAEAVAEVNEAASQPPANAIAINQIIRALKAAGLMEN